MRYCRISDNPCDLEDCPALFRDGHDDRRVIARGELLAPTDEIVLEDQEAAVVVPALYVIAAAAELGGGLTRVDYVRMFRVFATDAFRIETRDHYDVAAEAPAIAEFDATGRIIIYEGKQNWLDKVTAHTAAGRTIRRVHTVHASRLSAYLRWEFTSQATTNVPAGEDIRVLDLDHHPELATEEDVWIFDDAVGVKMWQPTPDGANNGVARATAAELDAYRAWQAEAWRVAVPLPEFVDKIGLAA
ncbi:MAG TPA: hypothetical protein VFQ77_06560 [Pseudonocardiaceae bacterium]|jgi:hypothetical protein|nr:hypothetical protein [Pseudonocardiaceae bacterium]